MCSCAGIVDRTILIARLFETAFKRSSCFKDNWSCVREGLYQGDALSPLLFSLVVEDREVQLPDCLGYGDQEYCRCCSSMVLISLEFAKDAPILANCS